MVLRVEDDLGSCRVRLIDVQGVLDQPTIDSILALKSPPPLNISPIQPYGAYSAATDGLQLSDIRYFGGKAANFGLLRRAIPANSPVSTAFSFDLWTGFLSRVLGNGRTLRQEIALRLAGYSYPPDMQALSATLIGIQDLIKDDDQTSFDPAAAAAVLSTLQDPQYGFDALRKLRHRSSTNVEDSDQFTGAGLYDSFNGCLADELDGDDQGPSLCDEDQSNERGVFRAIRKVFASFYNLNAYLERLRHGIDEDDVGMAILVHHSFPDADELANGVGTLRRYTSGGEQGYLVTQDGASSVTNPEPGAIPEEVDVYVSVTGTVYPTLMQHSNLVPLGATVMAFPDEYVDLTNLFLPVADEFELASGLTEFRLEFEYKKMAPGDELVVKQVRRIPLADDTPSITPFLINEPTEYCLFQGEYGDVFANHRLKSRWTFETQSLWLTEENLQSSFYSDSTLQYTEVCQLYDQTGPLPQWPQATHGFSAGVAVDGWRFGNLQNPRTYELSTTNIPTLVAPSQSPLLVLSDFGFGCLELKVDYETAVPSVDYEGPTTTTTDYALLCSCPAVQVGDLYQQRSFVDDGLSIDTDFYWPPEPEGIVAGYTAPLSRFVETWIHGLTTVPILLQGEHSQTYRPEHHNFSENFMFEPALEPGISQQQLDELAAAGVRVIYVDSFNQIATYDDEAWGDSCLGCTGFDGDQDGFCTGDPTFDCDDASPDVWATPGEARDLLFIGPDTLSWTGPLDPGGA
ncbi:MAG: PEP/pyruvate-binding domain-containing protein, partial [Planctomycetota bacterium]